MYKMFHVNPINGYVGRCIAASSYNPCPYAGESGEENHYEVKAEAVAAAETLMAEKHGTINSISKTEGRVLQVKERKYSDFTEEELELEDSVKDAQEQKWAADKAQKKAQDAYESEVIRAIQNGMSSDVFNHIDIDAEERNRIEAKYEAELNELNTKRVSKKKKEENRKSYQRREMREIVGSAMNDYDSSGQRVLNSHSLSILLAITEKNDDKAVELCIELSNELENARFEKRIKAKKKPTHPDQKDVSNNVEHADEVRDNISKTINAAFILGDSGLDTIEEYDSQTLMALLQDDVAYADRMNDLMKSMLLEKAEDSTWINESGKKNFYQNLNRQSNPLVN